MQPRVDAAEAVDAQYAATARWKTAPNAVSTAPTRIIVSGESKNRAATFNQL
jgi:hypothetical protein